MEKSENKNEEKVTRLKIDESIKYRKENFHGEFDRPELGAILFPDYAPGTRIKILSNWNVGKLSPVPTIDQLKAIAFSCGVSLDFIVDIVKIAVPVYDLEAEREVILQLKSELERHVGHDESHALQKAKSFLEQFK